MSEQIKDGGPAFPVPDVIDHDRNYYQYGGPGMTLRDYFAAKATEQDIREHRETDLQGIYIKSRETAKFAYADAMLAARKAMP